MARWLLVTAFAVALTAGCGGGSDGSESSGAADGANTQTETTSGGGDAGGSGDDVEGTYEVEATVTDWSDPPSPGMEPKPDRTGEVVTGTIRIRCDSDTECSIIPGTVPEVILPADVMQLDGTTLTWDPAAATIGNGRCSQDADPVETSEVTITDDTLTGTWSFACPESRIAWSVEGERV